MNATGTTYISVVGAAECDGRLAKVAFEVGREIARAGAVLVCGGMGGVMEAASRGAREAGGTTVGILPDATRHGANPHLTVALPTGLGEARNALVVRSGDAVVAVGGGYGTLSEIGLALKMGRSVIGIETWRPVRGDGGESPVVQVASPDEAVRLAVASVSGGAGR